MSLSSISKATYFPAGAAMFAHPTTHEIIAVYQAGSLGVTGLAYRTSNDFGATWSSEAQLSPRQNVVPSGVVNPATGDVHLAYGQYGDPSLSAAFGIWARVLVWNGSGWTIGGEFTIEAGDGTQGLSNPSLAVDLNGFITALYYRKTASASVVRSAVSNGPWDLTASTTADAVTLALGGPISISTRFLSVLNWWAATFHQDGVLRITRSSAILSPVQHAHSWIASQTIFLPTATDEMDTSWNPAPTGSPNGQLGIAYRKGTAGIVYRTWTAFTNSLSAEVALSATGRYPAIAKYFKDWIAGWFEPVSGDKNKLQTAYMSDPATVYGLDVDPGFDGWGNLRMPLDVEGFEILLFQWSDTADPGVDGYTVYLASVAVAIFKDVVDAARATESFVQGPFVSDSATGTDSVVQAGIVGVPISVSDSALAVESLVVGPDVFDTATGVEDLTQFAIRLAVPDSASAIETISLVADIAVDDVATAVDTALANVPVSVTDAAAATESISMKTALIDALASPVESVEIGLHVSETATGFESIVSGPDVADSVAAMEGLAIGVSVADTASATESFGNLAVDRMRRAIAVATNSVEVYPGYKNGWTRRGRAQFEAEPHSRMFTFEDVDQSYAGIVFICTPETLSAWKRMQRSVNGGVTFSPVGPPQMACVARGADGALWGVGNDGSRPVNTPQPPIAAADGTGVMGWAVTQRQIFRSDDRGLNWIRVYDDADYGNQGRFPSYVHVAADPSDQNRIMAFGVARGSAFLDDVQIAASVDRGRTWTVARPSVSQLSNFPVFGWALHSDSILTALADGRFMLGCTTTKLLRGQDLAFLGVVAWQSPFSFAGFDQNHSTAFWSTTYATGDICDASELADGSVYAITDVGFLVSVRSGVFLNVGRSLRAIASDGTNVFVGSSVGGPPTIYAFDSGFHLLSSLPLDAGDSGIVSMAYASGSLYASVGNSPARLVRIDVSDPHSMSRVGAFDLGAGEVDLRGLTLGIDGFVYGVISSSPARVFQFDVSGAVPAISSQADGDAGENVGIDLAVQGSNVYALVNGSVVQFVAAGPTIARFQATTFSGIGVGVGAFGQFVAVLQSVGGRSVLSKYDSLSALALIVSADVGPNPFSIYVSAAGSAYIGVLESFSVAGTSPAGATFPTTYTTRAQISAYIVYAISGSSAGNHQLGPTAILITDDMGIAWLARWVDGSFVGQDVAPFVDAAFRGSKAFAVRNDMGDAGLGQRALFSVDNGMTWDYVPDIGQVGDPTAPSAYAAVAYDFKAKTLYIGTLTGGTSVFMMDDPSSGRWVDVTDNLADAAGDATPQVSFRGLGILSDVLSVIDPEVSDAATAVESLSVDVRVADGFTGLDFAGVAMIALDAATATESFKIDIRTGLTVRLVMSRGGRTILRVSGAREPAVIANPNG